MALRNHRHVTGAAWLAHVQRELDAVGIVPEVLPSGAVRLCNGGVRITAAELRYVDAADLADLIRGRVTF